MTDITVTLPDTFGVVLRGITHSISASAVAPTSYARAMSYGIQRMINDRMKTKDSDSEDDREVEGSSLVAKFLAGEAFSTRKGGVGRTTNPVARERKRLASEEITANVAALLEHHKVSRKEFDEQFRTKYVAARLDPNGKHYDRLDKLAKANVAKAGQAEVELLEV